MAKIRTQDLTENALDWAVATALRDVPTNIYGRTMWSFIPRYSTDWSQGGPIIEREGITLDYFNHICDSDDPVHARLCRARLKPDGTSNWYAPRRGPTVLIAAMRCFVASKLGDEVEIPEELL